MSEQVVVASIPNCDICFSANKVTPAYADAYIPDYATWGYVCLNHFKAARCRLGTGAGQKLVLK